MRNNTEISTTTCNNIRNERDVYTLHGVGNGCKSGIRNNDIQNTHGPLASNPGILDSATLPSYSCTNGNGLEEKTIQQRTQHIATTETSSNNSTNTHSADTVDIRTSVAGCDKGVWNCENWINTITEIQQKRFQSDILYKAFHVENTRKKLFQQIQQTCEGTEQIQNTDNIVELATIFWAMWYEPSFVETALLPQSGDKVARNKLRTFCGVLGTKCEALCNGYIRGGLKCFVVDLMLEWSMS